MIIKFLHMLIPVSHGKFRSFLKRKAQEYSCKVIEINEAYTPKTCGNCGKINDKLGSKEFWECPNCGYEHDRGDINGARNIYLRALLDTTYLERTPICIVSSCQQKSIGIGDEILLFNNPIKKEENNSSNSSKSKKPSKK